MDYFTRIGEPKKLRYSMMSVAKDSVIMISMLESFVELRREKALLISELNNDFKEMEMLCKQLSDMISDEKTRKDVLDSLKTLPRSEIQKQHSKPELRKKEVFVVPKPETTSAPDINRKTEADRLEYTLAQIEKRLADLSK